MVFDANINTFVLILEHLAKLERQYRQADGPGIDEDTGNTLFSYNEQIERSKVIKMKEVGGYGNRAVQVPYKRRFARNGSIHRRAEAAMRRSWK